MIKFKIAALPRSRHFYVAPHLVLEQTASCTSLNLRMKCLHLLQFSTGGFYNRHWIRFAFLVILVHPVGQLKVMSS